MGMILKFAVPAGRSGRRQVEKRPATAAQCEIILFPGVRYERRSDGDKPLQPEKKGTKKRKRATRRA